MTRAKSGDAVHVEMGRMFPGFVSECIECIVIEVHERSFAVMVGGFGELELMFDDDRWHRRCAPISD